MQLAYSMYLFLLYRSQLDRSNNLKRLDMDVRTFLVSFDLCSWLTAEAYEFEVEEETWRHHACLTRRTDTIVSGTVVFMHFARSSMFCASVKVLTKLDC